MTDSIIGKSACVTNSAVLATTTAANAIPFDVALWDVPPPLMPYWDASAPTRLKASVRGRYLVIGSAIMITNAPVTSWHAGIQIVKQTGSVPIDGDADDGVFAGAAYKSLTFNVSGVVVLGQGEYVELTQNATFLNGATPVGGSIDNTARRSPVLQMVCLETF